MKLKKIRERLTSKQSMAILDAKYPHINYIPGENLNLIDAINDMLKKMWADNVKYPTILHMEKGLNMSERNIRRMAKLNGLPDRKCI